MSHTLSLAASFLGQSDQQLLLLVESSAAFPSSWTQRAVVVLVQVTFPIHKNGVEETTVMLVMQAHGY